MKLTIIYLLIYLLVLIIITYFSSYRNKRDDYINSSKELSAFDSVFTTFASLLTGYNFVIGVTFSFLYGFWYLMVFVGISLAFVVLYYFFKKKLFLYKNNNFQSIGDYFGFVYGKFSQQLINITLLLTLLLFLILQLSINVEIFSPLLGFSKITTLFLTVGIVCFYLWFGGFKASVKTDIFQGFLMLPIILTIFVFDFNITYDNINIAFDIKYFWFAVGLALLQFFSLLGQAESFQRIFASKDIKSLKKGLKVAFLLLILVAGAIAYLGINFKLSGTVVDPSSLFVSGILPALPKWLKSLLSISLVAAFMGTIDSSAFSFGVLLASFKNKKNISISLTRFFMVLGIIISALCSLYFVSFLNSVFALISIVSVVGASLLVSFLFKLKPKEINLFLIVGVLVFVFGLLFKFVTDNPLTALIPSFSAFCFLFLIKFINLIKNKKSIKQRFFKLKK